MGVVVVAILRKSVAEAADWSFSCAPHLFPSAQHSARSIFVIVSQDSISTNLPTVKTSLSDPFLGPFIMVTFISRVGHIENCCYCAGVDRGVSKWVEGQELMDSVRETRMRLLTLNSFTEYSLVHRTVGPLKRAAIKSLLEAALRRCNTTNGGQSTCSKDQGSFNGAALTVEYCYVISTPFESQEECH